MVRNCSLDDDFWDGEEEDEPFEGSCEGCGCDVYECEARYVDGDLYCDQCAWSIEESAP